mmetsp:Transcript_15014/g.43267  ORF Transcript_15014/g.43267 Transcript_15014/m.43267 type:complete len:324 (+) Transcript_15014:43-1014(+)
MADLVGVASTALPSAQELEQIAKIRADCSAEIAALTCKAGDVVGDLRICRFIRSRHGDVKEAAEWFRDFLKWRLESGMDTQRQEVVGRSPDDFLEWYDKRRNPYLRICPFAGRNDEGNILWFVHTGLNDPASFVQHRQVSKEEDAKTINLVLEWTLWYLDVLSRREERIVYCVKVMDFKGLGGGGRKLPMFVPEFKAWLQGLITSMQKHYCEHDTLFLLLNTPWIFRTIFGLMKLLLTKRQMSKIRVLGDASTDEVRGALCQMVPKGLLHAEYGGPVQRLVGFLPADSPEAIEKWYQNRHTMAVEYAAPSPNDDPGDVAEVSV